MVELQPTWAFQWEGFSGIPNAATKKNNNNKNPQKQQQAWQCSVGTRTKMPSVWIQGMSSYLPPKRSFWTCAKGTILPSKCCKIKQRKRQGLVGTQTKIQTIFLHSEKEKCILVGRLQHLNHQMFFVSTSPPKRKTIDSLSGQMLALIRWVPFDAFWCWFNSSYKGQRRFDLAETQPKYTFGYTTIQLWNTRAHLLCSQNVDLWHMCRSRA